MPLTQQGGRHIPQIFAGVDDVQHQRVLRKVRLHLRLQRFRAIRQRHLCLNLRPQPLPGPLLQARQGHPFAFQRRMDLLRHRPGATAWRGGRVLL